MSLVLLSLVGGLLALDGVSVAQSMVSRPFVTGAVIGALSGDLTTGMLVGGLLELYLLVAVPTGGGRFPEGSVAATVATIAAIQVGGTEGLLIALATGLLWGWVGGVSQSWMRGRNGLRAVLASDGPVTPARIRRSVLGGITLDFLRAALLCAAGASLATHLLPVVVPALQLPDSIAGALLLGGGMVSAGILLRSSVRQPADWALVAVAAVLGWWLAGGTG